MALPLEQEVRWFAVVATAVLLVLLGLIFTNHDNTYIDIVTIFWGLVIWVLAIMLGSRHTSIK